LDAEGKSTSTLRVYRTSVAVFGEWFIGTKGSAGQLGAVTRQDLERFLVAQREAGKEPATRHMRYEVASARVGPDWIDLKQPWATRR